ncbi:hypothetical protein M422DRAFT_262397 [Sphaerobolus stellatus SS14]|uniref:Uncharacterized protein n=1 Tax=Sphaerobolus stellatus (strain SS14) TaxID=990650 RepID=A0A0C9VDI4_SPHS4|nr:hypothetical protein M422DRAFT_262397 [Sphaerobolus stellatus SS14]
MDHTDDDYALNIANHEIQSVIEGIQVRLNNPNASVKVERVILRNKWRDEIRRPLIVLLEKSVLSPTMDSFSLFIQGHGPVTAMYLARLATSRLQSPPSAPRKWIELFWLADNSWAGPPGILTSDYTIIKLRRAISSTLVKFSVISDIALITPLVLNRAYPQHQIEVHIPLRFNLHTLSPKKLGAIHPFDQWAVGSVVRATNQPILTLCRAMIFTPTETARGSQSKDVFLAGDVQKLDFTLLDMRIQGGCQLVQAHSKMLISMHCNPCRAKYFIMYDREKDGFSVGKKYYCLAAMKLLANCQKWKGSTTAKRLERLSHDTV